jgi:oxygen-dependent protoporphyrinogen oxidase
MIAAKKAASKNGASKISMFMTLKNGLQELVGALENAFEGEILTGRSVTELIPDAGGYRVVLNDGSRLVADAVVLATPAYASAALLEDSNPQLAEKLKAIRYISTATVSLGYAAEDFEHPLNGFGFVIARTEPTRILACTWTSTKFTHRAAPGTVLLRAFVGGPRREDLVELDDQALITLVREELNQIMGISAVPQVARVFRWFKANPQYDVGHLERVDQIEALCPPGLYLTGSAYRGVGIPDCIKQGQSTALQVVEFLSAEIPLPQG